MVATKAKKKAPPQTQSQRVPISEKCDLIFPVSRIGRMLNDNKYANKIGLKAAIAMTACLEYLVAEVIDVSIEVAVNMKKGRIDPKIIVEGLRSDHELSTLFHSKWIMSSKKPLKGDTHEILRDERYRVMEKLNQNKNE